MRGSTVKAPAFLLESSSAAAIEKSFGGRRNVQLAEPSDTVLIAPSRASSPLPLPSSSVVVVVVVVANFARGRRRR